MEMKDVAASLNIEVLEGNFLQDFQNAENSLSNIISGEMRCTEKISIKYARKMLINRLVSLFDSDPPISVRNILESQNIDININEKKFHTIISDFLTRYSYTHKEYLYSDASTDIDPSILGRLYEQGLTWEERERNGVYFTSRVETELMCRISLLSFLKSRTTIPSQKLIALLFDPILRKLGDRDLQDRCPLDRSEALEVLGVLDSLRILDPACGSGAFLLGMFHEICHLRHVLSKSFTRMPPESASIIPNFQMIHGIDINPLALWITKIRLWIGILDFLDFDRQGQSDLIAQILEKQIIQGDCLVSNDAFPDHEFDIVIGNPPYVQHTRISPPNNQDPTKKQKIDYIRQIQAIARQDWGDRIEFHGQADYLEYFFLRGLKSLRPDGFLCFITSSTWLDGELGYDLRTFLVNNALIVKFLDTIVHKSFTQAQINTVITVLQRLPLKTNPLENLVQFCLFKIPFPDILKPPIFTEIDQIRETRDLEWGQISTVPQAALGSNGDYGRDQKLFALQNRWGMQFLKYYGPFMQVFNRDDIHKRFVPLESIATLKRGFTSGANGFFYLSDMDANHWEIERRFLIPLLKSPRELDTIALDSLQNVKNYVFFSRDSKDTLSGTFALRYIQECGEQVEVTIKGRTVVGFQNTETCRARDPWYALPPHTPAPIIIQKGFSETFAVYQNSPNLLVDQTFYEIVPKDGVSLESLLAVMNSTLGIFELLRISTSGLGGGLYRPTVNELRTLPVPDISRLAPFTLPESMKRRKIGTIFEECGLDPHRQMASQDPTPKTDRCQLDETLFDMLGIKREWLPELYRAVCGLVRDRMQKAARL